MGEKKFLGEDLAKRKFDWLKGERKQEANNKA